jgi:DNA segregation ATPase FtsK/SpoIIIE, S-DNA-T family
VGSSAGRPVATPGGYGRSRTVAALRTTELRPGRDRGTSIITGVSDAQFELLRWFFVQVDDDTGYDAATEVIARAVAAVAPGTAVEVTAPVPAIESRDLLDDLGQVLGDDRAKLADLSGTAAEAGTGGGGRTGR